MSDNLNLPISSTTVDKAYDDIIHPVASETGKLLSLIPRAINAALSPLDKWVLKREYNIEKTKLALENKLSSVNPDKIVSPEPYVAVPALQYISYAISNKELFDLYANLLSKAMYADTKENVHPSFVEIIKQLSPVDSLVLKRFFDFKEPIAAAMLSIILRPRGLHAIGQPFPERTFLECVTDIQIPNIPEEQILVSVDNLKRLGLITLFEYSLSDANAYDFVKHSRLYQEVQKDFNKLTQIYLANEVNPPKHIADSISVKKRILSLTPTGNAFCDICIKGFE